MKTFDELLAMTLEAREAYLEEQAGAIISQASPRNQLRLRAMHAKCRGISRKVSHPVAAASQIQGLMLDSALRLRDALKGLSKD